MYARRRLMLRRIGGVAVSCFDHNIPLQYSVNHNTQRSQCGFRGVGGQGADDISANPFTGVCKPGDGGNGGNGGANGKAGQGSLGTNYEILEAESGNIGFDGSSGSGGAAGKGGFHGTVGADGENGADGIGGSDGAHTTTPVSDVVAEGQSQQNNAMVDLPYAFTDEFFDTYLS